MRKLTEIFNTQYFPKHYAVDLSYLLSLSKLCIENPSKQIISDSERVREAVEHFRSASRPYRMLRFREAQGCRSL